MSYDLLLGKVPPQAKELEIAVLGGILLERPAFDLVNDILKPECFYLEAHKTIFEACRSLAGKNQAIDMMTVIEELKKMNSLDAVGGPYYFTKLTERVTGIYGIEDKCRIILQKFIQREIIRASGELLQKAYLDETDAFELLDEAESRIFEISNSHLSNDYTNLQDEVVKAVKNIEDLRVQDEHVTGVPSGYPQVDRITHGWQPTDMIVLAARPSVGKTAFALNLARNAALNPNKPTNVGFFSLEMSTGQLVKRLLSCQSEIYLDNLLTGLMDDEQMKTLYNKAVIPLGKAKIYIDDTAGISMFQLRSKARRMVNKNNVGLIIIDYLQLMSGDRNKGGNREQEISQISRDIKGMAKTLNVPVIALSQLSRKVEERAGKMPQLSDLRESGAIEQDSDVVGFLYRSEEEDLKNTGMLLIKKHRHGALEDFSFTVNNSIQKWSEITTEVNNWKPIKTDVF